MPVQKKIPGLDEPESDSEESAEKREHERKFGGPSGGQRMSTDDGNKGPVEGKRVFPVAVNVEEVLTADAGNKRKRNSESQLTDKDTKDMLAWEQLELKYVPEWWDKVRQTGKDHLKVPGISPEHMAYIIEQIQKAGPLRNANTAPEDEQERMGLMHANPEARREQLNERRKRGQGVDNYAVIADADGDVPILSQTKYGNALDHPNLPEFGIAAETVNAYLNADRKAKGKPLLAKPPLQLLFVQDGMKLTPNQCLYYENIAPKKNLFLIRLPGFKPDLRHLEEKEQLRMQKKKAKEKAQQKIEERLLDLKSLINDPNYCADLIRRIGLPIGKAPYPCQEKVRLHFRVQHAQTKSDHVASAFDFFRVDKLSEYELTNPGKPMPWNPYCSAEGITDYDELEEKWRSDFETLKSTDPGKYAEYEAMTHPSTRLMGIFGAPGLGKSVCATMAAATVLPRGLGRETKKERALTVFFIFSTYLNPLNQIGDDLKPLLQARYGEHWKDRICFIGSKNEDERAQHCPTVPDLMARLGETEVVERVKDEHGKYKDVTRTCKPAVVFPVTRRSAKLAYDFIWEITEQNKKAKKGDNKFVKVVLALDEADVYDVGPHEVVESDGKTAEVWPENDYAAQAMRLIVQDNAHSFAFYMTGTPSQHLHNQIKAYDGRIVLDENVSEGILRKHLADYQVSILKVSAKNLDDAKATFEPRTVHALEKHAADAGVFLKANELIPNLKLLGEFRILMQGRTTAELEAWRRVLEGPDGVCNVHGCDVKFFFVLDPSVKFSHDDGRLKLELKGEASNRKYKQFQPFQEWPTSINETFKLECGRQGKRSRPRFLILAGLDIIARAINLPKAQATVFTSLEHDLKNITDDYVREFIQKIRILRVDPDNPDQVKTLYLMGADDTDVCHVHLNFLQRYDPLMRQRRPPRQTGGSTGSTPGGKRKTREERDQEVVDANLIWDATLEHYPSDHKWPSRAQLDYDNERNAKAKKNDKKHENDLKKAEQEERKRKQEEEAKKLAGIPLHVLNSAHPDRQLCLCFRLMLIGDKRPLKKNETAPVEDDAKCSSWTAFLKEKRGKAAPATVKTLPPKWRFVLAEPYFQRLGITEAEAWILVAFLMDAPASTRPADYRANRDKQKAQCELCRNPFRAVVGERSCCHWGTCILQGNLVGTKGYCGRHFTAVTKIARAALAEAQPGVAYDAAAHFALGDARVQADPDTKRVPGKKYVKVKDRPTSAGAGSSTDPLPAPST